MKIYLSLLLLLFLPLVSTERISAQGSSDAAQRADDLRLKLMEVQTKEAELQAKLQQLDGALKPENIERALAGVGSTRPEELREARRRQLQAEKAGVIAQLTILAESRTRLESAIASAATDAYHESAKGTTAAEEAPFMMAQLSMIPRWLVGLVGLVVVIGMLTIVIIVRRH